MKKALLYTTALVSFATAAFANEKTSDNAMALSFQGSSKFEVGARHKNYKDKTALKFSPNQESTGFYTTQKASLKAEGKSDSLTYGAVIRLQTVGNMSDGMSSARNDRSHLYIDTDMGSVQLGSNFAASKLMQIDASTIASGTGGIDGDFVNFLDSFSDLYNYGNDDNIRIVANGKVLTRAAMSTNFASSMLITGVNTLSNRLDGTTGEQSRKITYLSPRISGLQLGVSFSPDFNNTGDNDLIGRDSVDKNGSIYKINPSMYLGMPVRLKNVWSMGLNYTNTFNDVSLAFSAVADRGTAVAQDWTSEETLYREIVFQDHNTRNTDSFVLPYATITSGQTRKFHDLETYSLGFVVGTNGFSFAASFHNDGKSLSLKNDDKSFEMRSSKWWTTGVAYENGPMSASLTYLQGKKQHGKNKDSGLTIKSQIVSLGADYEVAPGLKPFAEVSMVKYQNSGDKKDNDKSTVFLLGTKVKF